MYLRFFTSRKTRYIPVPQTNLSLREPTRNDEKQWIELRRISQDFLRKWEPRWPEDDLSSTGYHRRLRSYSNQSNSGVGETYFLFDDNNDQLLGGMSLTRINKKPVRSAVLGYWMGAPYAGKGHMSEAVPAILRHAFTSLRLKRVNAACLPHNNRSISLLERSGFQRCGFSPDYLEINGVHEDHVLYECCSLSTVYGQRKPVENAGQSGMPMV